MDKELFDQLHQSMKEAVTIAKGEIQPSRVVTVQPPDVNRNTGNVDDINQWRESKISLNAYTAEPQAKPKSYATLRAKMTPDARTRSAEQAQSFLQEMQAGDSVGKGQ